MESTHNISSPSNSEERLALIRAQISKACERSGRKVQEVQLVAVSKTHTPETIREFVDAGHNLFGENRLQEAKAKIPMLPGKLKWHFIGHLQKNKIRAALPLFEMFHGVDTVELAEQIDRIAGEMALHPRILLEVNTGGEASKFGFKPDQLIASMDRLLALERVHIEGLMTIPPPAPRPEDSRPYFVMLRELRDKLQTEQRFPLPQLSMGMSDDFQVAIEEGATFVRVGTALFGKRASVFNPDGGVE